MRKLFLLAGLLVAALIAGLFPMSPAQADHGLSGHWQCYTFATPNRCYYAGTQYERVRYVYVFDRTLDPTVGSAIREFVNAYNGDAVRRHVEYNVPYLLYLNDTQHKSQCRESAWGEFKGYSFFTVCDSAGEAGGHTWSLSGGHFNNYQPNVFIGRKYTDYNSTFSVVAHEFMHAMGMGHSTNCNVGWSIMGGSEYGCKLPQGVKVYLAEHDWTTLINWYAQHPHWH